MTQPHPYFHHSVKSSQDLVESCLFVFHYLFRFWFSKDTLRILLNFCKLIEWCRLGWTLFFILLVCILILFPCSDIFIFNQVILICSSFTRLFNFGCIVICVCASLTCHQSSSANSVCILNYSTNIHSVDF